MDMGHYVNSPVDEVRDRLEKRENCRLGWSTVFTVVGVSFGLLCIVQSVLNVSLRIQGIGRHNKSDHIHSTNVTLMSTADMSALKDQLATENMELQAINDYLTGNNEDLNEQLSLQQEHIRELQTEKERLMMRLSETEQNIQSCPLGWIPHRSSCYLLSTRKRNWRYAREDCEAKGAHLVILNDDMEEDALHTFGRSVVWISLKSNQNRGTWVDRNQLTHHDKIQPQPNDLHAHCAYSEKPTYGSMTRVGPSCNDRLYWVCEKELKR